VKKCVSSLFVFAVIFSALFTLVARRGSVAQEKNLVVAKSADQLVQRFSREVDGSIVPGFNENTYSKTKRAAVSALVQKGIAYLKEHDEPTALNAFTYHKDFIQGELYLFVFNLEGVCLAHGNQRELLWQNLYDYQDSYGTYVIRSIIQKAKKGGGWAVYEWKNATKVSSVSLVKKGNKSYIIGSGFYPHSKRDAVINLVNGAVSDFQKVMDRKGIAAEAFSRFSYPLGRFILGDLYLFVLDFDGKIMAQGDRPGLIGQNVIEHKDAEGKQVNKEIIKKLKKATKATNGIWVDYISKRAPKMAYARKVTDAKGKNYFIACGYYPTAGRKAVKALVRKGFRYMEMHSTSEVVQAFSSKREESFRFGDLFLFVYDMNGMVIAHGGNPDFIGKDQFKLADQDGHYFVQEIIQKAQDGGGWLDYKVRNSSRFTYVDVIEIGGQHFVIGSGLHPISKPEMMQLLVKGGASLLEDSLPEEAFGQFVKRNGDFIKGDMSLFVFDFNGINYVYGEDVSHIWSDMSKVKDDDGRPFIEMFIKTVKGGPGIATYKLNGVQAVAYLESVQKNGVSYLIGSSFYR